MIKNKDDRAKRNSTQTDCSILFFLSEIFFSQEIKLTIKSVDYEVRSEVEFEDIRLCNFTFLNPILRDLPLFQIPYSKNEIKFPMLIESIKEVPHRRP